MAKRASAATTIAHVARVAGVSGITVSRVLREDGPISADTRRRVLDAVRRTGYVRNNLAGSLASARSNLVGVILPSLSNNVFAEVMSGINSALARSGYQPMVGVTDYDLAVEQRLVTSILSWQPAALILAGLEHTRETARMLDAANVRVVEIMDIDERPIDVAIGHSHRLAGRAIARHLVSRGYRRFGYVGHDVEKDMRAAARLAGLKEMLAEGGFDAPVELLSHEASSVHLGRQGLESLLAIDKNLDVAVFSNDDMAVGGMFHCMAHGIDVPSSLALFGFNGLEIGQALPKPLSTVRSNRQKIGELAVETFLRQPVRPQERQTIDTSFEILLGQTA